MYQSLVSDLSITYSQNQGAIIALRKTTLVNHRTVARTLYLYVMPVWQNERRKDIRSRSRKGSIVRTCIAKVVKLQHRADKSIHEAICLF